MHAERRQAARRCMPENEQGEDELVPNARAQERPILVVLQGAELQTTLICQPTQIFHKHSKLNPP